MDSCASIGIDLGHSSVKLSVKYGPNPLTGGVDIFPTVVRPWSQIANDDTARKALNDTVTVNNRKFYIGVTAIRQGQAESFTGQTRNWIETDQHDALLVGAWIRANKIIEANEMAAPKMITLVLGLPASYYMEQRSSLRARAKGLIEPLLLANQTLRVFIESQSRAPLLCVAVDSNGKSTGRAGDDEAWGVVEIGHFTTDFTFHDQGQEVDGAASSASGAHVIYDKISTHFKQTGYLSDFETITTAIKTKSIKVYGKQIDVSDIVNDATKDFSAYILEEIGSRFGDKAQRMDGLIVAGGGAYIVGNDIMNLYPNAAISKNARFVVAEGYARFGLVTMA